MKSSNMKKMSILMAVIMVLGIASFAQARGYGSGPRQNNFQGNYAPLTAEQQAKADKMFTEHHNKMTPVHQAIITKQAELQAEMIGNAPNKAKIEKLSKELGELHGKKLAERVELSKALEKEGLPTGHGYGMGNSRRHGGGFGMHHNGYGQGGQRMANGGYGMGSGYCGQFYR